MLNSNFKPIESVKTSFTFIIAFLIFQFKNLIVLSLTNKRVILTLVYTQVFLTMFIQVSKHYFEIGFCSFAGNSSGCTESDWRPSRQYYKYLNVDRGPDSVTGMARPKVDGSAVSIIYGSC